MNALSVRPLTPGDRRAAVRSVSRSHVGLVRAINEDRVLDCAAAQLWAVADGMGGHRGGDLAAQTAVDALRERTQTPHAIAPEEMEAALQNANAAIVGRNRALGLDAGTTIVAAALNGTTARIAWVGDSRAYRLRDGRADLLTHDHSVVQELLDAGLLTPQLAEQHPRANVVTRALGVADELAVATVAVELTSGDALLLCSDGLSRSLRPAAVEQAGDLDRAADMLLANALARDGSDNISFVLIRLD